MDGIPKKAIRMSFGPVVGPHAKSYYRNVSQAKADFQLAKRWIFSRHVPSGYKQAPRQSIDIYPSGRTFRMARYG
jgi:hypothetical protein